jgi:hypothetical protein
MDTSEYKLIELKYSDDELKRIEKYNKEHVDKALDLFKYNKNNILTNEKELDIKKRVNDIQGNPEFKEFCRLYPIVSKYIIAFGLFSKKAFIKYLDWKAKVRPTDDTRAKLTNNQREQEKFKNKYMYAVYVKFLYQEKMNSSAQHVNLSDINDAYVKTYEALNKETDNFFDMYEEEERKQNEKKELNTEEKKQKILNQLKIKLEKNN